MTGRGLLQLQSRHQIQVITKTGRLLPLKRGTRHHRNRLRHVDDPLLTLLSRDNHFFQLVSYRLGRAGGRLGGGLRGKGGSHSKQRTRHYWCGVTDQSHGLSPVVLAGRLGVRTPKP